VPSAEEAISSSPSTRATLAHAREAEADMLDSGVEARAVVGHLDVDGAAGLAHVDAHPRGAGVLDRRR
jgi:hypothetical protein